MVACRFLFRKLPSPHFPVRAVRLPPRVAVVYGLRWEHAAGAGQEEQGAVPGSLQIALG